MAILGIWSSRLIRPERITKDEMLLAGVCLPFAEAAKELRDGDEPDEPAEPRRNRYDVDVDEEA